MKLFHRQSFASFFSRRSYSSTSTASPPFRILFCGTDLFAKTVLTALNEAKDVCSSLTVLTARDAPNTWQSNKRVSVSHVKVGAIQAGLPHDTVPKEGLEAYQIPAQFKERAADSLLLTASFGHLIPPSLLDLFPASQRLNLHPSLLPQLSGAAPIQWAIARQMQSTGVSVQTLGEKFDSGRIYAQEQVSIPADPSYLYLEPILAKQGSDLLLKVLRDLPAMAASSWPQSQAPDHLIPSKAPKLKRSDSEINWTKWTADEIEARHRGFGYLYPLTTKLTGTGRIIFRQVSLVRDADVDEVGRSLLELNQPGIGSYSINSKSLLVTCKDGLSLLKVTKLQSEGKRQMETAQWINGYRDHRDSNGFYHFE